MNCGQLDSLYDVNPNLARQYIVNRKKAIAIWKGKIPAPKPIKPMCDEEGRLILRPYTVNE
jgi:hypothetical protein